MSLKFGEFNGHHFNVVFLGKNSALTHAFTNALILASLYFSDLWALKSLELSTAKKKQSKVHAIFHTERLRETNIINSFKFQKLVIFSLIVHSNISRFLGCWKRLSG